MSRPLPRYRQPDPNENTRRSLEQKLRQIENDRNASLAALDLATTMPTGHEATDRERLRGIPCIARAVGGTSPGTQPEQECLRNDRYRLYASRRL